MKKRLPVCLALGVIVYGLLLGLLVTAERAAPQSGIRGLGDAAWFSLVTLATVGYGDVYPVTPLGRWIGALFVLFSVGVLASVLGMAAAFLHGRVLPRLRLEALRRQRCYVFSQRNDLAEALARDLLAREPRAHIVFCRAQTASPSRRALCVPQDAVPTLQALRGPGEKTVFLTGEDIAENLSAAQALRDAPVQVCCRGPESDGLPGARFFDLPVCAARAYWQAYPLKSEERVIVLAGGGEWGRAMLDQAVLVNCRLPFYATEYHLLGDWAEYRGDHPGLLAVFAQEAGGERDALIFHDGPWNAQPALLERADRVIFCGDDPARNAALAARLLRLFPLRGRVYAAAPAVPAPGVAFGRLEEICTADLILRSALDARARALHELYCRRADQAQPWEELSPFLKDSNRASADHLLTKINLLLPGRDIRQITPELCREAAARWAALPDRESCRRNEHERWQRYYALRNWRWGPEKDSVRRTHPCLTPYEKLSREEREKDDSAWTQLALLGAEGEKNA